MKTKSKKKIGILVAFLLCTLNIFADKIVSDTQINSSTRYICTQAYSLIERPIIGKQYDCKFGLNAFVSDNTEIIYEISVELSEVWFGMDKAINTPKNTRMLLKCKDDKVIELTSYKSEDFAAHIDQGTQTIMNQIGNSVIANTFNLGTYTSSTTEHFFVTESQLKDLFNGVSKFRFEALPDNIEKKWRGEKLGKNFKKCYEEINARIRQRASFNKDF
jgi:hypothetical protein